MEEPSKETASGSEQQAALAMALRELYQRAHGRPAGRVRVLLGPDSEAAWIEGVIRPAERTVARRVYAQAVLQRYAHKLLPLVPGL